MPIYWRKGKHYKEKASLNASKETVVEINTEKTKNMRNASVSSPHLHILLRKFQWWALMKLGFHVGVDRRQSREFLDHLNN